MALVDSLSLPLGKTMPGFSLATPAGDAISLVEATGEKGILLAFTCNHCPYAIAIWDRLIALSKEIAPLGITSLAINPNINPNYPDDAPDKMLEKIQEWGIPFPYLVDSTQEVAKAYQAQCTPDLYLLNQDHALVYHGRLDDNWKAANAVTRQELRDAALALANDSAISETQYPSMGCSIKWLDA